MLGKLGKLGMLGMRGMRGTAALVGRLQRRERMAPITAMLIRMQLAHVADLEPRSACWASLPQSVCGGGPKAKSIECARES